MKPFIRRIFVVLIASLLTVSLFPFVNSAEDNKAPSEWAQKSVEAANEMGIVSSDNEYDFTSPITREAFCKLAYNYVSSKDMLPESIAESPFDDTKSTEIAALYAMGIIKGKSETAFAPNDTITREEAAVILDNLVKNTGEVFTTMLYFSFADEKDVSDWAMNSVQTLCNMNVLKGVGDNRFDPKGSFTVEQAIVTLMRINDVQKMNSSLSSSVDVSGEKYFSDKLNAQMPDDKNYMFSPISIKMVLALAANGASGDTQREMLETLGISSLDEFNLFSKGLIEKYSKTEIMSLNVANSIWINKDNTQQNFSDEFSALSKEFYNADARTVSNDNAVDEINSWVSEKTNQKITEIIDDPDFWSALVNAVYFKGLWDSEFSEHATKPDTFNNADGTTSTVDFLNKTSWMPYAKTDDAQIIELKYKNRYDKFDDNGEFLGTERYDDLDVSMYLVLAEDDISLEKVLTETVKNERFERTYVKFGMPKFKIESDIDLNEMLMNSGILTAFNGNSADFTNMFDSGNMAITDVRHKTYINVDEKGTEAAAVTIIAKAGSALPPEPVEVKFDNPFYFAIRDNTSGEILFMGRYAFAN